MTLIVSLRIPDGIVLAGDSLATMQLNPKVKGDVHIKCPQCGHEHDTNVELDGTPYPSTTFPYSQKIFPFLKDYGIGTSGVAQLSGKTIYFALRELQKEIEGGSIPKPTKVSEVADLIEKRAQELLLQELTKSKLDINKYPDGWSPISFQVVGYENDIATTIIVYNGKKVRRETLQGAGCTVIGQMQVVTALWTLQNTSNEPHLFDLFSLQDAVEYAEHLIDSTASYQRFLRTVPTVGGDIDIALITPFAHFKWIRQKELFAKISEADRV
jgi:hypothetical protein